MLLDNSGHGPLRVPGYGGVPRDYKITSGPRFAHGINDFKQSPRITARELAMLDAMSTITDKQNWHVDIFNDTLAEQWREEIHRKQKLIGKRAWAWCLLELRDKAVSFAKTGYVQVVDAGSCVCKSDKCIPSSVAETMKDALQPFYKDYSYDKGPIAHAIDPRMYPLVVGKSLVLQDGKRITLSDFRDGELLTDDSLGLERLALEGTSQGEDEPKYSIQRLPCEVEFVNGDSMDVKIVSPINNLHPRHHAIYTSVERVLSASIPLWNNCLVMKAPTDDTIDTDTHSDSESGSDSGSEIDEASHRARRHRLLRRYDQTQQGRIPARIVTYGLSFTRKVSWSEVAMDKDVITAIHAYRWAKEKVKTNPKEKILGFGQSRTAEHVLMTYSWVNKLPPLPESVSHLLPPAGPEGSYPAPVGMTMEDWHDVPVRDQSWKHPQPGVSFSYEDWKVSRDVERSVVKMIAQRKEDRPILRPPEHQRYDVHLEKTFRNLQVIVEARGIHLPDQIRRSFTSDWDLEGNEDEHIVASALYVYDMANVSASVEFRQETPMPSYVYRYEDGMGPAMSYTDDPADFEFRNGKGYEELEGLVKTFGFRKAQNLDFSLGETAPCTQQTGSVKLSEGRLLTFPNTFETSFKVHLHKGHDTGHLRYLKIHLVDPYYKICSTANVPPQQYGWWEHTYTRLLLKRGFPREIVDQIVAHSHFSMSDQMAERYKRKLAAANRRRKHIRQEKMGSHGF